VWGRLKEEGGDFSRGSISGSLSRKKRAIWRGAWPKGSAESGRGEILGEGGSSTTVFNSKLPVKKKKSGEGGRNQRWKKQTGDVREEPLNGRQEVGDPFAGQTVAIKSVVSCVNGQGGKVGKIKGDGGSLSVKK